MDEEAPVSHALVGELSVRLSDLSIEICEQGKLYSQSTDRKVRQTDSDDWNIQYSSNS